MGRGVGSAHDLHGGGAAATFAQGADAGGGGVPRLEGLRPEGVALRGGAQDLCFASIGDRIGAPQVPRADTAQTEDGEVRIRSYGMIEMPLKKNCSDERKTNLRTFDNIDLNRSNKICRKGSIFNASPMV